MAVTVFFATSGFLVAGSLLTKRNLTEFFVSRALRIYPGLWVAVIGSVLAFGFFVTKLSSSAFFSERSTWRYLLTNMAMLGRETFVLPGVFQHLPAGEAVNGSLWSLPVEIRMYLLLGAGWWLCARASKVPAVWAGRLITAIAVTSLVGYSAFWWRNRAGYVTYDAPWFSELTAAFFCGAVLRVFQHRIPATRLLFFVSIALMALGAVFQIFAPVYAILFAYPVLYLALVPRGPLLAFNQFGDYSYGIYIYAFAVQQTVVWCVPGITPLPLIGVSFVITLTCAVASWHWVEKRALRLRKLLPSQAALVAPARVGVQRSA